MNNIQLLYDESINSVSAEDMGERGRLVDYISKLPEAFLSKMRHLQPQVGCLNCCSVCSRDTSCQCEYWTESQLRNVISAIKTVAMTYRSEPPYLAWDRQKHRKGQIFAYRDDDIGAYPFIDLFVRLAKNDLGVKLKISTVGFSRHNEELCAAHKRVNEDDSYEGILSMRLSFTPFAIGWNDNDKFSKKEYEEDVANFLHIYRPLYDKSLEDKVRFLVALRFRAYVCPALFQEATEKGKHVIICGNYAFVTDSQDCFQTCSVNVDMATPEKQSEDFDKNMMLKTMKVYQNEALIQGKGIRFRKYILADTIRNEMTPLKLMEKLDNGETEGISYIKESTIYRFSNREGCYYSVDPLLTDNGYYALNLYPTTDKRPKKSGFLDSEKFLYNAINAYRKEKEAQGAESLANVTFTDVENVIVMIKNRILEYRQMGYSEYADFIESNILDTIIMYANAIKKAGYSAALFFDMKRSVDTGMVSNIGRAYSEYQAITSLNNEPITPFQTRNFGNLSSVKTQEDDVWDLCCTFGSKLSFIQPPKPTDSPEEQENIYENVIDMFGNTVCRTMDVLNDGYYVPGQILR